MRLLSVPAGEARRICQPLRKAFLRKMGLPPGTAAAAADSFVWLAEQDELATERVLMLMRLLGGGGVPARLRVQARLAALESASKVMQKQCIDRKTPISKRVRAQRNAWLSD